MVGLTSEAQATSAWASLVDYFFCLETGSAGTG